MSNGLDYISLEGMVDDLDSEAWDGVSSGLEPGEYALEIVKAVKGASSKGTPQIEVDFQVCEGPAKGRKMKGWYYFTEKAISRTLNLLKASGVALDARKGFSVETLFGRKIKATVREEEKRTRNPMTLETIIGKQTKIVGERAYS